jgi:hypothetical protein
MVCLGKSNYFRFNHPKEAKRIRENNPGNRFSIMPDKYYPGKYREVPGWHSNNFPVTGRIKKLFGM